MLLMVLRLVSMQYAHIRSESDPTQHPDNRPADINLPPTLAETGRCWLRVMIAVPVLTPRGELERTEPPDVLAGINAFGCSWFQVEQTVDEALKVETVGHTNGTNPEQTRPTH